MTPSLGPSPQAQSAMQSFDQRMDEIKARLDKLINVPGSIDEVVLTDAEVKPGLAKDWPVVGAHRAIVQRSPDGGNFPVPTSVQLLWPADENRLGIVIVNTGTVSIVLFLGGAVDTSGGPIAGSTVGLGQISLPPGASWLGKIGDFPWAGSVLAAANGAAGSCTICVV